MYEKLRRREMHGSAKGPPNPAEIQIMRLFPQTLLTLFLTLSTAMHALTPVNPDATPRTRATLDFIVGLEPRTEKRLLSGQFVGFGPGAQLALMDQIHAKTGQWPAIIGVDYANFNGSTISLETAIPNRVALAYARAGGIVTVSAHLYNPANPADYGLRDKGVDLDTLLQPGTPAHARWMHQLDEVAAGLQELRAAGAVVLWRPFHEMNGDWFWWGAKKPAAFVRLWRHMFDYFTTTKGLDNLLWVYGPNHMDNTADYYPGDDCVDIVGFDAYTDHINPKRIHGYPALAKSKKPLGFTEYGPFGSKIPPGDYDYRRFIDGIMKHFPRSTFFMCWDDNWSLASNLHTRELLAHPWVVNRDDLPSALGIQ